MCCSMNGNLSAAVPHFKYVAPGLPMVTRHLNINITNSTMVPWAGGVFQRDKDQVD